VLIAQKNNLLNFKAKLLAINMKLRLLEMQPTRNNFGELHFQFVCNFKRQLQGRYGQKRKIGINNHLSALSSLL
jgi:hypothetical protein